MDIKEKAKNLIKQMTLEEKASLCSGANLYQTKRIDRLGIPQLTVSDGPHGLCVTRNREKLVADNIPSTCFPTASSTASSWDVEVARRIGEALGEECNELGIDISLGPGINMKRTPLCGRNFEYFSEDPCLAGELGAALVKGLQSRNVGACVKHFACNNQEFERTTINAVVDERTLREIYLAAFERIVKKAKPWSIMSAYNFINGVHASESRYLLTEILRQEWGFDGLVISDWWSTHDRVKGIIAGMDLEMPGPSPGRDQSIVDAVRSGELDESALDEVVGRILEAVFKAQSKGAYKPATELSQETIERHHALARELAGNCLILLKNERSLLPLNPEKVKSAAVIGMLAKNPIYKGGGSSSTNATKVDSTFDELEKIVGGEIKLAYAPGYSEDHTTDDSLIDEAVREAAKADVALLFVGVPGETESMDRKDLNLPAAHERLIKAVIEKQPDTIVVMSCGSAVDMSSWVDGVPSILYSLLGGQAVGGAIADIISGRVNPSGKLAETFPKRLEDTPAYINFPGENGNVIYGEGIFIGYRYYDKKKIEPLFPFGYGLSYTTFEYGGLEIEKLEKSGSEPEKPDECEALVKVSLTVTNTGKLFGKEIVQLYVSPKGTKLMRPEKELKAFAKVPLEPGESRKIEFILERRDFCCYDTAVKGWVPDGSEFHILIGSSSRDIKLSGKLDAASLFPDNPSSDK